QIPPPISPKQDPQQALTQQIDYYFSLENLIRDIYLRKNMDTEGWVSLSLILNFKRVKIIINGIQNSLESDQEVSSIILETVKNCQNLEINYLNEKDAESATIDDVNLRVKDNFEQWLL
ncbi:winged helix DNA-binding domain-containing protein, partial [Suhomyces tanzawaensis NRRL Y-17324]